jgi:hypothetical protein
MNWQDLVAIAIVAATAGLLLWARFFRKRRFSFQRDTHCGCSGSGASNPNAGKSIVFHARKDGDRKVIMKAR